MKTAILSRLLLAFSMFSFPCVPLLQAIPVAGVDFDNGAGGNSELPDDLDLADGITVSAGWTYAGGGGISFDANSNTGRAAAPVGKLNGLTTVAGVPAVGSAPPAMGIHSFSLTIGPDPVRLANVRFDFSNATPGGDVRWIAFRTSLDASLIFSQNGIPRPGFTSVDLALIGPQYSGLANQTVEFFWYAGGAGSGDIDIDSIVIETGGAIDDSDGDTMPDAWEQQIVDADAGDALVTVADVLPGADFDQDGASNLLEYLELTDPLDPDSDNDGYLDGVETNDGSFDDIATDTGTNPLDADTDGDGLLDGVETNTGIFNGPTDAGSNPHLEDTDGDDFRDGTEVNRHGTDPTMGASVPDTALEVLFVGGGATAATGADSVVLTLMQEKYGISNVTYLAATATVAGSENGFDLLVLSSTPASGDLRGKFQDSTVPVVNWEEAISDNSATGEFGLSSELMTKSTTTTGIAMTGHPIGQGLPPTVVIFNATGPETTGTGLLFPGLASGGNAVDGTGTVGPGLGLDLTGYAMILTAEAGDAVDPLAGVAGNTTPARRVMLPWTDNTIASLTPDGLTLFGNALDWAAGRLGEREPLRFTEFLYDDSSEPGNIIVTLTFTSELGKTYTLYSSTDLDSPVQDRPDISDSIIGGEGTTTIVVDYNFHALPIADPTRFFVVREND